MDNGFCEIFEVGPRDGLQNENREIPVAEKIALVGSAEVLEGITRGEGVRYAALAPNLRGYTEAVAAKADEIAIFASASEGFSQKNINVSIDEAFERFVPILEEARHVDIPVRGYVSCVIKCPYDGIVAPSKVAEVADRLFSMGCYEVSLGDTIGAGTPDTIARMLLAVRDVVPAGRLAGHYHDTNGRAIDNIDASLSLGVRVFDAAVGGLGGCPYAPGAAGNVATEKVNAHLAALGYRTGLDQELIEEAAAMARAMRAD